MAKRPLRRFGIPQTKRRLKALKAEMLAIGSAYDQSAGEIRRRILALIATLHEILERFPLPPE